MLLPRKIEAKLPSGWRKSNMKHFKKLKKWKKKSFKTASQVSEMKCVFLCLCLLIFLFFVQTHLHWSFLSCFCSPFQRIFWGIKTKHEQNSRKKSHILKLEIILYLVIFILIKRNKSVQVSSKPKVVIHHKLILYLMHEINRISIKLKLYTQFWCEKF